LPPIGRQWPLGTSIVQALAKQVGATVEIADTGNQGLNRP
jgi:hypothetical protein